MPDDRMLTVEQVAALLQLNVETVRRYLRRGKLRGFQIGGKDWRIPAAELERYTKGRGKP